MTSIDIDDLPELEAEIGIAGSALRDEVGGDVCFSVAVAIAIYTNGG